MTRKTRAGCDKDFRKPRDPEKAHENFQLGSGYEISEHEFVVLLTNQSSQKYKANCYAKNSDCFKNRLFAKNKSESVLSSVQGSDHKIHSPGNGLLIIVMPILTNIVGYLTSKLSIGHYEFPVCYNVGISDDRLLFSK